MKPDYLGALDVDNEPVSANCVSTKKIMHENWNDNATRESFMR